jgi:predicted Zn-dependent protease
MDNPEQLAAVLAHEMQHVVQRHSMKGMVRAIGLQAVLSLVLGDAGILGDLAGNLTALQFIRSDEESADDAALQTLLRARIAPSEMQKAFGNLAKSENGDPLEGSLKYLSTHPPLSERIERVRVNTVGWHGVTQPIGAKMSVPCATIRPASGELP